jgi:hypothetical protein
MVIHCAYCRRGNEHHGVCDGCGAPLPEIKDYSNSRFWGTCAPEYTYYRTGGMFSYDIDRQYNLNPPNPGYHNRRLK